MKKSGTKVMFIIYQEGAGYIEYPKIIECDEPNIRFAYNKKSHAEERIRDENNRSGHEPRKGMILKQSKIHYTPSLLKIAEIEVSWRKR